jgi:hypothetical protein
MIISFSYVDPTCVVQGSFIKHSDSEHLKSSGGLLSSSCLGSAAAQLDRAGRLDSSLVQSLCDTLVLMCHRAWPV